MIRLVVIGARQHAKVVVNILRTSRRTRNRVKIIGYVDDNRELAGKKLLGLPIVGRFTEVPRLKKELRIDAAIMGISNLHMGIRSEYFRKLESLGMNFVNAIHDSAIVENAAKIGKGVVLNPLCVVNAYAEVGDNVVAYSGTTIEHEDRLGNNVYLGPGVNLASGVVIGDDTFIGVGVKIVPDIHVGKNVTIGAGSVIIDDIPDNSIVVGVPGRILKRA